MPKATEENKTEEHYFHVEYWERRCTWVDIKAKTPAEAENKLRRMIMDGLIKPPMSQAEEHVENCGEITKQEYEESEVSDKGIDLGKTTDK